MSSMLDRPVRSGTQQRRRRTDPSPSPSRCRRTLSAGTMIKSPFYRFSLTAGPDFVRQLLPGARFASEPPGMFAGGRNLPLITASGVDVDLLRHLAWQLRHSAAFSPDRELVDPPIQVEAATWSTGGQF